MATDLRRQVTGAAVAVDRTDPSAPDGVMDPLTSLSAVHIKGLDRSFGSRRVLQQLAMDIAPGEFVALLGRSGSGKSTLLRILAGLDRDWSGSIRVPKDRSVVFQDARLLPWARVLGNVTLGLGDADAERRGRQALSEVGLTDHLRAWPRTLSGGEAQRVALARALVRRPDLLLLDEPFGALDALTRLRMHALLAELCRVHRPAVLLVTHDVDEAITLADRVRSWPTAGSPSNVLSSCQRRGNGTTRNSSNCVPTCSSHSVSGAPADRALSPTRDPGRLRPRPEWLFVHHMKRRSHGNQVRAHKR